MVVILENDANILKNVATKNTILFLSELIFRIRHLLIEAPKLMLTIKSSSSDQGADVSRLWKRYELLPFGTQFYGRALPTDGPVVLLPLFLSGYPQKSSATGSVSLSSLPFFLLGRRH
jgi:hypothetical protein